MDNTNIDNNIDNNKCQLKKKDENHIKLILQDAHAQNEPVAHEIRDGINYNYAIHALNHTILQLVKNLPTNTHLLKHKNVTNFELIPKHFYKVDNQAEHKLDQTVDNKLDQIEQADQIDHHTIILLAQLKKLVVD
jgi:hypothetical protein